MATIRRRGPMVVTNTRMNVTSSRHHCQKLSAPLPVQSSSYLLHRRVDLQAIAGDALSEGAAGYAEQLRGLHLIAADGVEGVQDPAALQQVERAEAVAALAGLDELIKQRAHRRLHIGKGAVVDDGGFVGGGRLYLR